MIPWSRRRWLTRQALGLAALLPRIPHPSRRRLASWPGHPAAAAERAARVARQAERLDPALWQALAQRAVEAARAAGARYADARLTRIVRHDYAVAPGGYPFISHFMGDEETIGVGVRALVGGYWGFSASAVIAPDEVVRLAQDAVGQAKANNKGVPWTVELGQVPVATGMWETPCRIDPFTVPIEEKEEFAFSWIEVAGQSGVLLTNGGGDSWLRFIRQERVVATSDGALFTQTLYESGGFIRCCIPDGQGGYKALNAVHGIDVAGAGWERLLDANIPEQFLSGRLRQELEALAAIGSKPSVPGKYTLVCDGATMAALVERTLGVATQLDRALGYEANAGGTSFIDDPLAMVGQLSVASPLVTLTANRSAPQELATVQWDDEGVAPEPFTLVKDGVLTDFQTTREQAAWLAPYYQQHSQPVRSHGCAAAESAHVITLQHMPNLSMEPSANPIGVEDLVADVRSGILIERGQLNQVDFQARTGMLGTGANAVGSMRQIVNGKLGRQLSGGVVLFRSQELWKAVKVVGGASTQAVYSTTYNGQVHADRNDADTWRWYSLAKGQPPQISSHSVRAVAATIHDQPLIFPGRKG